MARRRPEDIEPASLDLDGVRALPHPTLLRNGRGALYLWDGRGVTRHDGTVAHVEDEGPWTIAAIPVAAIETVVRRTMGVDEGALLLMVRCGRDMYAESVGPGPRPPIPYRDDPLDDAKRRCEDLYFTLVDEGHAMHYNPLPWLPHGHWAWTPEQRAAHREAQS